MSDDAITSKQEKDRQRAEIERHMREFLAKGGEIQQIENGVACYMGETEWLTTEQAAAFLGLKREMLVQAKVTKMLYKYPAPLIGEHKGRLGFSKASCEAWLQKYGRELKSVRRTAA